ncbi:MAG: hypothetical protein KAR24_00675 [Candidatus Pacebacteria bacterium]|nr:hypothetical protein [Candidatus Paceibacterota bacterium]
MLDSLIQKFAESFVVVGVIFQYFIYWGPFVLGFLLWNMWRDFLLKKWLSNMNWILLEVKLPKDIKKTPLAMELMLNSLYQTSGGPWTDKLFKGRTQDWFSLEIVSIEGSIHFFIRVRDFYKNFVESQIYAQYPSAEIYESADYARRINYKGDESQWQPWGLEYRLAGPDPLPIATYVDFGMNKGGVKDEEQIDPLTTILEMMGTCGKGEQIWLQIGVKASGKRFKKPGSSFGKQDWVAEGEKMINEINTKYKSATGGTEVGDLGMTASDKAKIQAITRNISKIGFDCGIRGFYWVNKKQASFDVSKVKGLVGMFIPFKLDSYNEIKIARATDFDFPWEDFMNIRVQHEKRNMFDAYKRRSFFFAPHKRKPFVLNAEELATIYHFPGMVAETPTFGRIESRKGEPPTNLPI